MHTSAGAKNSCGRDPLAVNEEQKRGREEARSGIRCQDPGQVQGEIFMTPAKWGLWNCSQRKARIRGLAVVILSVPVPAMSG